MISTVLIVDDHPLMREGLRELLAGEPDIQVCGEADSAAGTIQAVEALQPTVVLLDITLGTDDGVALVEVLHKRWPSLAILMLSMHDEALYGERLLTMGVRGYLMKQEAPQVIVTALRKVIAGEHYVSPSLASHLYARVQRVRDTGAPLDALTPREQQVLKEIARGRETKEIAVALGMSAKTVDSHRRNMREKLGLATAADLVRYAVRWAETDTGPASH